MAKRNFCHFIKIYYKCQNLLGLSYLTSILCLMTIIHLLCSLCSLHITPNNPPPLKNNIINLIKIKTFYIGNKIISFEFILSFGFKHILCLLLKLL